MAASGPKLEGLERLAEIVSYIATVAVVLLGLYVAARFIRWGFDPHYHLFRK